MLLKYLNVENADAGHEYGMYFMFICIPKNILCISLHFLKKNAYDKMNDENKCYFIVQNNIKWFEFGLYLCIQR